MKKNQKIDKTDWDEYYEKPFRAALLTRKITTKRLIRCLKWKNTGTETVKIMELGGGDSCFYREICENFRLIHYWIVDNNEKGLQRFRKRNPSEKNVTLLKQDVLQFSGLNKQADIVFSVGLIEHFLPEETKKAIKAHFVAVRSGGIVVISFPTPTWLYRITRLIAEKIGVWKFADERPLPMSEVLEEISQYGKVLHKSIIWPIILTQGIVVVRNT